MPLPSDEHLIATTKDVIAQFKTAFGAHPGFRPAHAHGALVNGIFKPSGLASKYTTAPHLTSSSPVPITARFSSSTGIPQIPDTNPNANPRGLAIRFNLPNDSAGKRVHTDFITHSTPFFPTRTGEEFLGFLKAIIASPEGTPSPSPIEQFLGSHPAALAHVQAPKPFPVSLGTQSYYGVTALKFVNKEGKETYFRVQIVPTDYVATLSDEEVATKSPTYLFDELASHVASSPISFKLLAQVAQPEAGDLVNDATSHWPSDREVVDLGQIVLDKALGAEETLKVQKGMILDPIPRIEGIEPSEDPLLEFRAALYLISGRERRSA